MIVYDPLSRIWRWTLFFWHMYWTDEFMTMSTRLARLLRAVTEGVRESRHLADPGF